MIKNRITLSCLIFLSLTGCGIQGVPHLQSWQYNREAIKDLKETKSNEAFSKLLRALEYDPFLSPLHLNLGVTFEVLAQAEKALQAYREAESLALKSKDSELLFIARFNQGQLLGKVKQVDEALAKYQAALEVDPTSVPVKVNIELLIQQQKGGGGQGDKNKDKQEGDQDQKNQGQGEGEQKDQEPKEGDQEKDPQQAPQQSQKYKPREFSGKELSEGDVKKILGELKQQEERIRAEYNKKEAKEKPRDKDW